MTKPHHTRAELLAGLTKELLKSVDEASKSLKDAISEVDVLVGELQAKRKKAERKADERIKEP